MIWERQTRGPLMNLAFADGFGHYTQLTQKWTYAFQATISPGSARGSGVAGAEVQSGGNFQKSLFYRTEWVTGFAVRLNVGESGFGGGLYELVAPTFGGGSAILATVFVEADASLSVYAGPQSFGHLAGNTGVVGGFYFVPGVWFYIEVDIAFSGSPIGVTATLYVNTKKYLNGATATGTVSPSSLICQGTQSNVHIFGYGTAGSGTTSFADIYINETTEGTGVASGVRGDIQVGPYIVPRMDSTIDWSESSGAPPSYVLVDEVPPDGDATYVFDYAVPDVDDFFFTTIASLVGEIQAVHYCIFQRKDNEGTRITQPVVNGGALTSIYAYLADNYYYYTYPMDTEPGGGAWSVATVNESTFGLLIAAAP